MSIVIDSLRSNSACDQPPSANDQCQVEATFHILLQNPGTPVQAQGMWADDRIIFRRVLQGQQVRFVLDESRMRSTLRSVLRDHRFDQDLSQPDLQASLDRTSSLTRYIYRLAQGYRREHPEVPERTARLMEAIADYALMGNIVNPDSIQQEHNRSIYRQLVELPRDPLQYIRLYLLFTLSSASNDPQATNRTHWSPAINARFDRLVDMVDCSERIRQQTARVEETSESGISLRSFVGRVLDYLYTGQVGFEEVRGNLRAMAQSLYENNPSTSSSGPDDRLNLYRILSFALEPLRGRAPFSQDGAARDRFERLFHWVRLPQQSEDLEYSALSPDQALERSIFQRISNLPTLQGLLRGVNDVIGPPFLTSDWLRTNGYLIEIVHAVVSAIRVEGSAESSQAIVDGVLLNRNLEALFSRHNRDNREFIAGALAVLRSLFGANADHQQLTVFWNGTVRELPFSGRLDREGLRSLSRSLTGRIRRSLGLTERLLPAMEGVICALGVGGIVADSLRMGFSGGSDVLDNVLLGASGFATGSGCLPLIGRAVSGPPRNAWLRDGILGGIGGLSFGSAGALIPFAFRPMPTPPLPIDGRNPTMGHGP